MRVEPRVQPLDVRGPAVAVADRVELQLVARHAEVAQQRVVVLDHLGVDRGVGGADALERELRSARGSARAAAPRSGTSARACTASPAAARGCIPCSTYARQIGAVPSGRSVSERPLRSSNVYISFWTMSEPAPDVRAKSVRVLEHRRLDAAVAVERAEPLHLPRHLLPERLVGREDVVRAARRLDTASRAQLREERVAARARRRASSPARARGRRRSRADSGRASVRTEASSVSQSRAGKVDAADRAGEEQVAAEEAAVGVEGDVRGRVARDRDALERDARRPRASRRRSSRWSAGYERPGAPTGANSGYRSSRSRSPLGHVDRRAGPLGEVGDAAEVVEVPVRDEDRRAGRAHSARARAAGRRRRRPGRSRPPRRPRGRRARRSSWSAAARARTCRRPRPSARV